jgi:hypothetical protein
VPNSCNISAGECTVLRVQIPSGAPYFNGVSEFAAAAYDDDGRNEGGPNNPGPIFLAGSDWQDLSHCAQYLRVW